MYPVLVFVGNWFICGDKSRTTKVHEIAQGDRSFKIKQSGEIHGKCSFLNRFVIATIFMQKNQNLQNRSITFRKQSQVQQVLLVNVH